MDEQTSIRNFAEWLRTNKTTPPNDGGGGYLIPQEITVRKRGIVAWIARLFGKQSGWETLNLCEEITRIEQRTKAKHYD